MKPTKFVPPAGNPLRGCSVQSEPKSGINQNDDVYRKKLPGLLIAGLLTSTVGCETCQKYSLTCRLWTNAEMRNFHEPSPDAGVNLYRVPAQGDVLVLYNEGNEKNDSIRRRAYLLNANLKRIQANRKPRFLNPDKANGLEPIPVEQTATPRLILRSYDYATAPTNGHPITLHMAGRDQGPYELPVYAGKSGLAVRAVLTPFAVVGDAALFAGITAILFSPFWGPALSGRSF